MLLMGMPAHQFLCAWNTCKALNLSGGVFTHPSIPAALASCDFKQDSNLKQSTQTVAMSRLMD